MKKLLIGLSSLFVLLFIGCGGDGDDSTSTTIAASTPNTNQYDLRTFIDIPGYTIYGVGTIGEPAGTINAAGSYQAIYNGPGEVPTHTHEVIMALSGEDATVEQNFYAITYMGNIIYTYDRIREVECETPLELSTITPIPTDAQVGYKSDGVELECNDGIYKTTYIHLDDAGGGNAELTIITYQNQSDGAVMLSTKKNIFTVTPVMSIISAEIMSYHPMDPTESITALYSTSIEQD